MGDSQRYSDYDIVSVGTEMRRLRRLKFLRSYEFSNVIDIAETTISQIENGNYTPTPSILKKWVELTVSKASDRIEEYNHITNLIIDMKVNNYRNKLKSRYDAEMANEN
jgi:DNA-binding XRE family transcriptional regulator